MLTNAHTSAATANGSTLGFPPQPPSPVPPPAAPVGSGSGPTGIAPVSSGPHGGGPEAGIGSHYRRCIRETGHLGASVRVGRLLAMPTAVFPVTGDPEADELLVTDPFALLVGMLLDQQVPMEWAFRGPATLRGRLGTLDAKSIAAMSPDEVEAVFRQKPALHRYPGSMAKRTHALATHIVDQYDGDAAAIWRDVQDPKDALRPSARAPGLRRGEGEDLPRDPREAARGRASGLGAVRRTVRRREPALGRRHRLTRSAPARARVEAGAEEGGQDQGAGVGERLAHQSAEVRADRAAVVGIRLV